MNCSQCQAELSAYLDGELGAEARAALDQHVAGCAGCRAELQALQEVVDGVRALPAATPVPEFLAEVRQKLDAVEERSWATRLFRPAWPKVPLEALAAVVVLFGVIMFVAPQYQQTDRLSRPGADRLETEQKQTIGLEGAERATDDRDAAATNETVPARLATETRARKEIAVLGESQLAAPAPAAEPVAAPLSPSAPTPVYRAKQSAAPETAEVDSVAIQSAPPVLADDRSNLAGADTIAGKRVGIKAEAETERGDQVKLLAETSPSGLGLATDVEVPKPTVVVVTARDRVSARARLDRATTESSGRLLDWNDGGTVARVAVPSARVAQFRRLMADTPEEIVQKEIATDRLLSLAKDEAVTVSEREEKVDRGMVVLEIRFELLAAQPAAAP